MLVEAYKDGNNYIIPIVGKENKIEINIDEDKYHIDWIEYMKSHSKHSKELTKEEYIEERGASEYRNYLMLDKASMEDNWETLVITHENPYIDDNETIEEAHANWDKE